MLTSWEARSKRILYLATTRSLKTSGFRSTIRTIIEVFKPKSEYYEMTYKEWTSEWIEEGEARLTYKEFIDYYIDSEFENIRSIPSAYKVTIRNDGCYGIHLYEFEGTQGISLTRVLDYSGWADRKYFDIRYTLHIIDKYDREIILDDETLEALPLVKLKEAISALQRGLTLYQYILNEDEARNLSITESQSILNVDRQRSAQNHHSDHIIARAVKELGLID